MVKNVLFDPVAVALVLTFVGFLLFKPNSFADNQAVVMDSAVRERLMADFKLQNLRQPSSDELASLIENFIREEALYQEALRLKVGLGDPVIRRRHIQLLKFLYQEFDDEALVAVCDQANVQASKHSPPRQDNRIHFDQIYFKANPPDKAAGLAGDAFPLGREIRYMKAQDIRQYFGNDVLRQLMTSEDNQWHGPFVSPFGYHFVSLIDKKVISAGSLVSATNTCLQQQRKSKLQQRVDRLVERRSRELIGRGGTAWFSAGDTHP